MGAPKKRYLCITMAKFRINILGCGSATPTLRHMPSCQVVDFRDRLLMIDCGEGAQLQMRRYRLKYSRLNHFFISHLHGDHVLGLPGLLSTMSLHGVEGSVTIHISAEGADIMRRIMAVFCREPSFEINYDIITPDSGVIYEDHALTVETFPLYHRVETCGFILREKPKLRHIDGEMAKFHNVPTWMMDSLRRGADFVKPDGTVVANRLLTRDADPAVSYAYCSDTAFDERVARAVAGVDTIYHEATYGDDSVAKAKARGHSTARQAAEIARMAGARQLIIGHYSKSYDSVEPLLAQAREVFPNTIAAGEGLTVDLI